MSTDIGKRLLSERRHAGITQAELARVTGIPQNAISRYERGLVEIPAVRLGTIALALRISIATLDTRLLASPQHPAEIVLTDQTCGYAASPVHVPVPLIPLVTHWDELPPADQSTVTQVADLVLAKNGLGGGGSASAGASCDCSDIDAKGA